MISKFLTRWYGAGRWPETDATVVSRDEAFHHEYDDGPSASARITFYYRDLSGAIQSGHYHVDDASALYRLKKNEVFRISFNSRQPSKYYCRDAATFYSELPFVFWSLLGFGLLAILIIWSIRIMARS